MGFQIGNADIEAIINCVPDSIERVLRVIQVKLEKFLAGGGGEQRSPPQQPKNYQYDNQQMNQMVQQRGYQQYQNQVQQNYE